MKTLLTLATLATLTAGTALAGNLTDVCANPSKSYAHNAYISANRPGRLNLAVEKCGTEPLNVRILDDRRNTILRTAIAPEAAILPVDIRDLTPGTYTVEYSRNGQIETDTFTVKG